MAFGKPLIIQAAAVLFFIIQAADGKLGGLMEIEDVEHNKEVQDLGRYSVEEFNKALTKKLSGAPVLAFVEVVSAEKQIVSGSSKYYLKIAAKEKGVKKLFESEVVVKSKTMLGFRRSTGN